MKIVREQKELHASLIRVTVDEKDYSEAVEKTLREYKRKANIPGFRPGMVPMGIVKKMYGKGVVAEESYRLASHSAFEYLQNEKIDFMWNSAIEEIKGEGLINEIVVKNLQTGELTSMKPDPNDGLFGLFVFIGYKPQTELFVDQLDNERGYLVTDDNMHTNIPGVFAAGDIRKKTLRQVVTAAADGAIAAVEAGKYIEEME